MAVLEYGSAGKWQCGKHGSARKRWQCENDGSAENMAVREYTGWWCEQVACMAAWLNATGNEQTLAAGMQTRHLLVSSR